MSDPIVTRYNQNQEPFHFSDRKVRKIWSQIIQKMPTKH